MKCLVLGGGGFLGSHLCDALLDKGYAVKIFDRPNLKRYRSFSAKENIEWVEGDFANKEDISQAVPGCDIIFHMVSTTLPKSSNENPVYDIQTNLISSLHLLESARKENVRKIIFASSGGTVYGIPDQIPIKETHSTNPICSYGVVKLSIEKYLQLFNDLYGLDYCILRLANPFGERHNYSSAQGAVSVFSYKALANETIEIWGDGGVIRDYVYVDDVVDAFLKAIDIKSSFKLFNIGSGQKCTLNKIIETLEDLLGRSVLRSYTKGRVLDVPVNVLDVERARDYLGWSPKVEFEEGIKKMLESLSSEPAK